MSAGVCIPDLIEQGKIPKVKGAEAMRRYEQLLAQYDQQMGGAAAEALATTNVLKALEGEALLKRRRTAMQMKAQDDALANMADFRGAGGGVIDPRAAVALLDRDGRAPYSNVEGRRKAIKGRAHAMLNQVLADHRANLMGAMRSRAQMAEVVRAAFGEPVESVAAREMAEAWAGTAEMLRQRFNAAGGDIGKLEKWGLPQAHDSRNVRAAGYETWRAEILPRLDRNAMIDRETGEPFSDAGLERALADIFETIRSEGWNKRAPGSAGQGAMATRHADPRFLVFKSADDWAAYAERFGSGTPFDAMMRHVDGLSREIAMMEVLGPNPSQTIEWLKDTITASAQRSQEPGSSAIDKAFAGTRQIDRLWNELTGVQLRPENRNLALAFSALRSMQTAAKLGSATLSAVTDLAFQASTRHYNGLPVVSTAKGYLKLFRPGAIEDQKLAVRLGLIADEWASHTAAQGRYLNEELTGETARRLAEGVLRLSGLQRWTQAGRWAFGMEFLGAVTESAGKRFDELDPSFRAMFERNGIDAADWETIRATPLEVERGVGWIKPQNVEDRALGDRLLEAILTETDYAVPVPDLKTRALINSVAPRGTVHGELIKSAFLFKSFGISVMLSQMNRIVSMGSGNAARYAAGLVIGTTVMGAVAAQLKLLSGGKDPREMDDPAFWGAAALQGGGFGIFGDFLSSTQNRFGGGFAGTLAGPIAGDVADIAQIRSGWDAAKFAKSQLPGQSLWYTKLAFDRLLTDQIQEEIDPNYRRSWRRLEKYAREQGTDFYWAPGETAPERAPDFSNAFGETLQ